MEIHPYSDREQIAHQLALTQEEVNQLGFGNGGAYYPESTSIIMGTFPPRTEYQNRRGYFYFSSHRNQFWRHVDAIYNQNLYCYTKSDEERITNAHEKIRFAKEIKLGFLDVFVSIDRANPNGANDDDIIPVTDIFTSGIFEQLLSMKERNFITVYSLSRNTLLEQIALNFPEIRIQPVRIYNHGGIPLEVLSIDHDENRYYISYCPIHGPIPWNIKQVAMQKAIVHDFL